MRQEIATRIARGLSTIMSGQLSVTLGLWGEPGVGKTTLAAQVLRDLPCDGRSVPARATVQDLLAALPRPRSLPPSATAHLARLVASDVADPSAAALTVAQVLSALAPFVLHVDDVHDASEEDAARLVALGWAVRRSRGVGLLATGRTALPPPFRSQHLAAMTLDETSALLERELGSLLPPDAVAWLHSRTGGNPLYALEFTRFLTRQGYLWSDGRAWRWRVPPASTLPLTVDALITRLVAAHTEEPAARAALESRALLPYTTDMATWRATAGLPAMAFAAARDRLHQAGLLRGTVLAHPLIGEVVAVAIPPARRRGYARRAVRALLPRAPAQAVDVFRQAEFEDEEARRIIGRALSRVGLQTDPVLHARLLELAAERESGAARARLALQAEGLLHVGGNEHERARLARLALDADPDDREARWRLASACAAMGRDLDVQALVDALPVAEQGELRWVDVRFRAQAQGTRAAQALRTWRAHPELAQVPGSVVMAASAHVNVGDLEGAERVIAGGLALAALPGRAHTGLTRLLAFIRSEQGHLEEAEQLFATCLTWLEAHGSAGLLAACHYERSFTLYRQLS
ncbi:AAA family ATPase, partial [uncultured Deinococcus sp.]|uniref:AAA family ATPase n=1 Tax=uncultured Deinococcus sp. TaxID=158789 RepID=UPI00345C5422